MTSVVIAAHNEEAVIARCLKALSNQQGVGGLQVVVAANGCTDKTAAVARAHGADVVETDIAGKANALNLADEVATGYPRIYLDADIALAPNLVDSLVKALAADPMACAAVPARHLDVSGRPVVVRAYTAISARHPAFEDGLFGRGVIALSERGRSRFTTFPKLIADDLFLDSLFSSEEKLHVETAVVKVDTPLRSRDLIKRLVRVRRGNAELRAASRGGEVDVEVRDANRSAWLTKVVLNNPRLLPAGVVYAGVSVLASILARRKPRSASAWERDNSTRAT